MVEQAEAAGIGSSYISPGAGDVPSLGGALHGIVFTRNSILESKSQEIESFQTAIDRALEVVGGAESKMRELLDEYLDGTPEEAIDRLVPVLRAEVADGAAVSEDAYEVGRSFHADSGLVSEASAYSDIVPESFR